MPIDIGAGSAASVQAQINAVAQGQTIALTGSRSGGPATGGVFSLPSNRKVTGSATFSNVEFGFVMPNGSVNIDVDGLILAGAGFTIGNHQNIRVHNSQIKNMNGHAFYCGDSGTGLQVENNDFSNIGAYGVIEAYNLYNLLWKRNRYVNCRHGGHFLGPRDNCQIIENVGKGLRDWLFEIQRSGQSVSRNLLIQGNQSYDYSYAFGNTGGIGCIAEHGINTVCKGNYLRANFVSGAQQAEGRLHVCIESGFDSGAIDGNIIGSENPTGNYVWQTGVSCSGANTIIKNTKFFGRFGSGFGGDGTPARPWPGDVPGGYGSYQQPLFGPNLLVATAPFFNTWDTNYAHMPPPPALGGPLPDPFPDPQPVGLAPPTNLKGRIIRGQVGYAVELTWTDNSTGETGFEVWRKTTNGADPYIYLGQVGANATLFTDNYYDPGNHNTPFPNLFELNYKVRAVGISSISEFAGPITIQIPDDPPRKIQRIQTIIWYEDPNGMEQIVRP